MNFITEEVIYQKSSQEITALLYEALMNQLSGAIDDIKEKKLIDANKKLQKSNDILYRLGAGINYEAGIIADQLDALYNYMADNVIEGNRKKDIAMIQQVLSIAERLAEAWSTAMKTKPSAAQTNLRRKTNAYEQNVMVLERETERFGEEK
ncbi:flagellar export chaperone FliS [Niallia sp. Krafla_26]|uniref:flagellar export chaperone FliS n=1 Tax=Niallia sp. Krafla_26 TaxID=3064703 RepID=UPI003D1717A2